MYVVILNCASKVEWAMDKVENIKKINVQKFFELRKKYGMVLQKYYLISMKNPWSF